MTTAIDNLIDAIENGLNLEWVLRATQLDEASFFLKLEDNQFNADELKQIRIVLKEWKQPN